MALKIGDRVPDFTSKTSTNSNFDSRDIIGQKVAVIYFYPKDNTAVCTAQACSFRDQYQDFKDLGAEVIGISADSIASHEEFAARHALPFVLLSDSDKKIKTLFGVPSALFGLLPGRVTYVVDKNGYIVLIFNSVLGNNHIVKALKAVKNLVS
ncbi:peroxiredoxin [Flavobacterium crassostreae]|uniref:thioredoxin-dependent peroxiredoxin n=1 Tax=Flavobacterium crassostreae TaxID=1763534 RepID=A0A1B9E3J7_9FLAO|nr:peroxiredoxin [Flavobacterium crassostreae]OCB76523.1 peroxiredoxin [Flavobacterium crassostreae]